MKYQKYLLKVISTTNHLIRKIFPKAFDIEQKYPGGFPQDMTSQTAYNILGITNSTSEQDLIKKHRKLIMINHPDKGGSTYLTLKINEAKDFILKSRNNN